jgi:hypothetical protein
VKPAVTVSLSYFNVMTSLMENESKEGFISRPAVPSAQKTPPKEIDLQRNRIMVIGNNSVGSNIQRLLKL